MFGSMQSATAHEPLLGRSQRALLEVSTVLYFFAKNSAIPLVQQYVYFLVAKKYNFSSQQEDAIPEMLDNFTRAHPNVTVLDPASNVTAMLGGNVTREEQALDDTLQVALRVNEESSLIVLYLNVAELFPAVFMVLVLGFWSDMTGRRKFLMWLPCLGNAVYALGFLLPLYICNGDIDHPATKVLFVMASLVNGLSGSVPGFLSGNATYISDTDSPRRRTLRLSIVEFSIGMTFASQSERGAGHSWRDFRGLKHVFALKTLPQKKLWAVFFAFQIYVFVQQGQERTFVLFLQNFPLSWRPMQIGVFLFILYALAGLGAWPGVPLLQRITDDASIAILAMLSKMLGSFLLAFAEVDFLVYAASIVQIFHLTPYAVARSLASLQAGEDEQGSVYAMVHSAQSLMAFLGPVVHNAVFMASLTSMSGLVFIVSGPLLVIPVALLVYMKYLERLDDGYLGLDGSQPPLMPTPGTPLSETSGFATRGADFGTRDELYQ
ncbi:hypothetical protein CAPTEDRAFT_227959 [Capitella teleta]|uniref:Major facilitator superfamily (MFS) profile domain-containing protein n=1 Tax=Capitella teleta TaxID=283909 RepID=R7TRJ1_CAPTE|nr:hypothetical protein CAPTEDRAFT_227959 [Capitella teleta]|eukprot:ELT94116.1 hypothetical protein CAPTEDRAFT_227959 [Capitella teleta]